MEYTTTDWAWPWWSTMVIMNVITFLAGVLLFKKSQNTNFSSYTKKMRILGLIFVSVALYRSVFVSSYYEQLAWFDSFANSSLLIRFFALFAELSFAGLFTLALLKVNKDLPGTPSSQQNIFIRFFLHNVPYFFFGCLFIAQFFATSGLVTKFEVLFAIEETLWGIAFLSIAPLAIAQLRRVLAISDASIKPQYALIKAFTIMTSVWCVGYGSYSVFYHLSIELWPDVIHNLQHSEIIFKTGFSAISDAATIVNQTRNFSDWGGIGFFIWHSGYFSLCVWMVLLLMNGPRLLNNKQT